MANPKKLVSDLPAGWMRCQGMNTIEIKAQTLADDLSAHLEAYFKKSSDALVSWLTEKFVPRDTPFERQIILDDFENLKTFVLAPAKNSSTFIN